MDSQFKSLLQLASHNQRVVATALAAAVIGIPVFRFFLKDYRDYIAIGPGGPPHNILGYITQMCFQPLRRETCGTACYDDPKVIATSGPNGNAAFLSEQDIPERSPPRPIVGSWTVPSRQLTELADEHTKERYQTFLQSLASSSPSDLKIATSYAERHGPALFVASSSPTHPVAKRTKGEIAHMHASDGSLHLNLAPKDAKLVLERGWAERHPLSGVILYLGLVMVYAPRGDEELKVVESITRAGAKFMLGEGV